MGLLYRLDFHSGKSYIGITRRSASARFNGHADEVRTGSRCVVHNAWRKYGAPQMKVLAILENKDLLDSERRAVRVFGTLSPAGYNMTPGGEFNQMLIPELVARVSMSHKGKKLTKDWKKRIGCAMKGKTRSSEQKAFLSSFWKWNPNHPMKRPEIAAKLSEWHRGRKRSTKSKEKMAVAMRAAWANPEMRAKWLGARNIQRAQAGG